MVGLPVGLSIETDRTRSRAAAGFGRWVDLDFLRRPTPRFGVSPGGVNGPDQQQPGCRGNDPTDWRGPPFLARRGFDLSGDNQRRQLQPVGVLVARRRGGRLARLISPRLKENAGDLDRLPNIRPEGKNRPADRGRNNTRGLFCESGVKRSIS